jgi:hypothetical protein
MGVKFTETTGRVAKAFNAAELAMPFRNAECDEMPNGDAVMLDFAHARE